MACTMHVNYAHKYHLPFPSPLQRDMMESLWKKGINKATKKENRRRKNKWKGNRCILTIWAEVIYQNNFLDEVGRGPVQDAAGIQRRKRQSLWVAIIMLMVILTQVCCAVHYSRNTKLRNVERGNTALCMRVHWKLNCKQKHPRKLQHLNQTWEGPHS